MKCEFCGSVAIYKAGSTYLCLRCLEGLLMTPSSFKGGIMITEVVSENKMFEELMEVDFGER